MILFLNANDNPVTWNKKQYLLQAAERLGFDFVRDLKTRTQEPPEYVLNIEPYDFHLGTKMTFIWEIDLLCDRPQMNGTNWTGADIVFLSGLDFPSRLNGLRHKTIYLPQACDPVVHRRIPEIEQEFDYVVAASFTGPRYVERERLYSLLSTKYSNFTYGVGSSIHEYVKRINKAKIQFIRSMKSDFADGEVAQRFFECLAIGPVVTNYVRDLDYLGLEEGVDYYHYKSDAELMEKMDRLLKDPILAAKMAAKGREKALSLHTYDHRLITILNHIHEKEAEKDKH